MSRKVEITQELATLKRTITRERERGSGIMNWFLLVVNTVLTGASL